MKVGDRNFKNHLDGYNFLPYLKGKAKASPRHEFFYFIDRGDLYAARYDDWKISFKTVDGHLFIRRPVPANIVQYLTK
jgi:arylsulfatase A-like enzyme